MARQVAADGGAIKPEPHKFDDNFLDVIGNEFKFDHAKGLAEWLKNSADAYLTVAKVKDPEQYIVLRFKQGQPKRNSTFECIDFVGMTKRDIEDALKWWGLATAAKKGTNLATFGGHGNGGKFYMRQMFARSRMITYREGRLNIFGFDEKGRYGYASGYENKKISLAKALEMAGIDGLDIPEEVTGRWKKSPDAAGFTVVRGEEPERFTGKATVARVLERLRLHPQARRVITHKQLIAVNYGQAWGQRLTVPEIKPKEGFETREIPLPKVFEHDGETFSFRNKKYPGGKLILRTSAQPLARSSELSALNTIDILGEVGCLASYRMNELGVMHPEGEFIYGECYCSLLEDEKLDCVRNDREKLVANEFTDAFLAWIRRQVEALASEMGAKRRDEKRSRDLKESALFNQVLNRWKDKFMVKLTADIFGGSGIGGSFGGAGGGGEGGAPKGTGKGGSDGEKKVGEDGDGGGGSGDEKRRGPRFPRVLLTGHDWDPLDEGATGPFEIDARQPPVYQRDVDITAGIYWINTARPLAAKIMDQYGASSTRWREYLFQRYVEIIFKQSIYELAKREPEMTPDKVDNLIDTVTGKAHDAAAEDLESFLFEDKLTGAATEAGVGAGDAEDASDAESEK